MKDTKRCIQSVSIRPRRVFEGVVSGGKRVPGVYHRDGNFWVRVRDPLSGKYRWAKPPDQTLSGARRFYRECAAAVGAERVAAVAEALSASRVRAEWPSVEALLEAYVEAAAVSREQSGKPARKTEAGNVAILRTVVAAMGYECRSLGVDRLPALVQDWSVRELKAGRNRQTVAAMLRNSRGVFAGWAMSGYRRAGLRLPPDVLDGWARVSAPPVRYELPSKELRDATIAAGDAEVGARSDLGLAFALCYYAAMSAADAVRAEWGWLRDDEERFVYRRRKTGRRADPPIPLSVAAALRTWPLREGRELILPGGPTDRYDLVTRDLASWMRGLGWHTGKCAHELRKLACSTWATRCGIQWAARWIGDGEATAAAYYRDLLPEAAPSAWD